MSLRLTLAGAGFLLALAPAALAQPAAPPPTAEAAAQDKAFNDAVGAARASLPVFWARLADGSDDPDEFSLKVVFPSPGGGVEELWLWNIKRDGGRITGRLNVEPQALPNMHRGQMVPINEANIIDWTFKEGRKRYGHFTSRVLAKDHPEDSAKLMATLSDNPLPADGRFK